jgi:hypothetical protein
MEERNRPWDKDSAPKTLRAAGAALLAYNGSGIAQTEAPCGQILDAPLRSRAVLTIDSRPAGLDIVRTDQEAIHLSCTVQDAESAREGYPHPIFGKPG